MRPIPRKRHHVAALVFAGCAALAGYFAMLDDQPSKTQVSIATVAVKRLQQETLFRYDPVFGDSGRWRFHTPFLQSLLEVILVPTGYQDLMLPFRALTGVMVLIYLTGMYALLYRQCRSWSISAYVAVLSSAMIWTLERSFWGIGSLGSILPPAMLLAVTPLIVLSYLRYENQWRVILVFAFIGVCGNLHLVTAVNLTLVMLITYLGRQKFRPSAWPVAVGCAAAAAVTALPYMGYYLHLRYSLAPADAAISAASVYEALRLGNLGVVFPDMLKSLLNWMLLVLVLLVPAVGALSRIERYRVRDLGVWVWLAAGALCVALLFHGAILLIGLCCDRPPATIDFAQASSIAMLPLYVLFAQGLTSLFRVTRRHRGAMRWACAALLAAWMLPSDNLRVGRHLLYEAAASFVPDDQKPLRVQELAAERRKAAELAQIAAWARAATPADAVFLIDQIEFRMLSRRAILASSDDVKYYYYVTPWQLDDWIRRVRKQQALLQPPSGRADVTAIAEFVAETKGEGFQAVPAWYVILPAKDAPDLPGPLEPVAPQGWGAYYCVYRVP